MGRISGASRCRIGFVGTGGVADRHARVLAGFDDAELVAATDIDPERARRFADAHGLRATPDVASMVGAGVDAVYVCVPPAAHGAPEVELAAAGTAIFIEKPVAADVATAEWVARRIALSGVRTRVGLHWRCAEPVRRARALLAGRRVRVVSAWWLDRLPPVPWWTDRLRSGGPIVEQAVHVLDLVRVLVGEVTAVHALSAGNVTGGSVDAASASVLRFDCGAVGTLTTACVLQRKHRAGVEIVTDDLVLGVGEDWLEVLGPAGDSRETFDPWPPRVAADRAFVDELSGQPLDERAAPPDHAEALRTHRLACALARSAVTSMPEPVR